MSSTLITIIICSYNRSDFTVNAVKSIFSQENIESSEIEILVIDNNSTDDTKKINALISNYPNKNIKYILEKNQGLSYARNSGYQLANGKYVGYLDDDALAEPNWIQQATKIIKNYNPDIFGGPIYPFYLDKKPDWFRDDYEIRQHFNKTGWIKENYNLSGSNMFFKTNVLKESKGFNPHLGMQGKKLGYGEETFLLQQLQKNSYNFYYDINLIVKHYVPPFKLNLIYFFQKQIEQAKTLQNETNNANRVNNKLIYENQLTSISAFIDNFYKEYSVIFQNYRDELQIDYQKIIEKLIPQLIPVIQLNEEYKFIRDHRNTHIDKFLDISPRKILNKLFKRTNIG